MFPSEILVWFNTYRQRWIRSVYIENQIKILYCNRLKYNENVKTHQNPRWRKKPSQKKISCEYATLVPAFFLLAHTHHADGLVMAWLGFYTTWLGLWPWRELMCQRNNDTRTDWGCNHTVFTTYKALDRSNIGAYLLATTKICKVILKNFSSIFCYIMSTLIHDLTALSWFYNIKNKLCCWAM